MREVSFFVPIKPKGKGRPRFNSQTGAVYTPKSTKDFERIIRWHAVQAAKMAGLHTTLFTGPVSLIVIAFFNPVKSDKESIKSYIEVGGQLPYRKKPDADNIVKSVADALNRVVYYDDNQITEIYCAKKYSKNIGLQITVREIEEI